MNHPRNQPAPFSVYPRTTRSLHVTLKRDLAACCTPTEAARHEGRGVQPRRNALLKEGSKMPHRWAEAAELLRAGLLRPVYHERVDTNRKGVGAITDDQQGSRTV